MPARLLIIVTPLAVVLPLPVGIGIVIVALPTVDRSMLDRSVLAIGSGGAGMPA
jgi:hypothetical protein